MFSRFARLLTFALAALLCACLVVTLVNASSVGVAQHQGPQPPHAGETLAGDSPLLWPELALLGVVGAGLLVLLLRPRHHPD